MSLNLLLSGCINDEDISGSGCINGKVVNEQGEGIADVNLQLINKEGASPYSGKTTFTDQEGNYAFQEVTPADNYMLIATHPDYETDTTSVNVFPVTENECASENIALSLSPQAFDEFIEAFIFLGERGNSKYYLSEFITTWLQAKDICNHLQVHLVTINSQEENTFLVNALQGYGVYSCWIGLTDEEDEGVFRWVTGEPLDFTNWRPLEPSNSGDEDYVTIVIQDGRQWNDFTGTGQLQFIVERENK